MKKIIINILATTGTALVVLAFIAAVNKAEFLLVSSVFQTFFANIVIHSGLLLTRKFESKYPALEAAVDIAWTSFVLIIAGAVFGWYSSTPVLILVIMSVLIYLISVGLSMVRMHDDISEINKLLQKRKKMIKFE